MFSSLTRPALLADLKALKPGMKVLYLFGEGEDYVEAQAEVVSIEGNSAKIKLTLIIDKGEDACDRVGDELTVSSMQIEVFTY